MFSSKPPLVNSFFRSIKRAFNDVQGARKLSGTRYPGNGRLRARRTSGECGKPTRPGAQIKYPGYARLRQELLQQNTTTRLTVATPRTGTEKKTCAQHMKIIQVLHPITDQLDDQQPRSVSHATRPSPETCVFIFPTMSSQRVLLAVSAVFVVILVLAATAAPALTPS
eukprot:2606570-Rhodomonas_salina.1